MNKNNPSLLWLTVLFFLVLLLNTGIVVSQPISSPEGVNQPVAAAQAQQVEMPESPQDITPDTMISNQPTEAEL
jgi:hypothetical protein